MHFESLVYSSKKALNSLNTVVNHPNTRCEQRMVLLDLGVVIVSYPRKGGMNLSKVFTTVDYDPGRAALGAWRRMSQASKIRLQSAKVHTEP